MTTSLLDIRSSQISQKIKDCLDFEKVAIAYLDACDDEALSGFREEYQKMIGIIKRTRYRCEALIEKTTTIREEIVDEQAPVDLEKIITDEDTLKVLRTQHQNATNILTKSQKRQEELEAKVRLLKTEIGNLGNLTKQGVSLSQTQQRVIDDLQVTKDGALKELEGKSDQITKLKGEVSILTEKIESCQGAKQLIDAEILALKAKSSAKKIEAENESQVKEKLEKEVRHLSNLGNQKQQEISTKQFNISRISDEIKVCEGQIKIQQNEIEKLGKDQEILVSRTVKVKQEFDDQLKAIRDLEAKNEVLKEDEKLKNQKLSKQRHDTKKLLKLKDVLVKKTRELEETKAQEENIRKMYRDENENLLISLAHKKKTVEIHKKNLDDLIREREILQEFLKKTTNESTRLSTLIQFQKDQQASLGIDLSRLQKEITTNKQTITSLTAEIDSLDAESETFSKQITDLSSSLKDKELIIFEYKSQILQAETKLLHQQSLYESLQADRLRLSKELIEKNNEIKCSKRMIKEMGFEVAGIRREVLGKNEEIVKQVSELSEMRNETDKLKQEIDKVKIQIEEAQISLKTHLLEVEKLDKFGNDAKIEKVKQEKCVEMVLAEKEKIAAVAREKNKELKQLCEKLNDQKLVLSNGEAEYKKVLKDIEDLRNENLALRVEISQFQGSGEDGIESLKNTSIRLAKEITQAKSKITFLEQELENPMNIHRWRKLEVSEPELFKSVQLLHTLQKKVIAKNEEIMKKESAIQEKEKLYLNLKTTLAKQAGPEALLQLSEFQKACKDKASQLGTIETELQLYKSQVDEYRYDIKVLDKGLEDCKKQMMEMYVSRSRVIPVPAEPQIVSGDESAA